MPSLGSPAFVCGAVRIPISRQTPGLTDQAAEIAHVSAFDLRISFAYTKISPPSLLTDFSAASAWDMQISVHQIHRSG